MTDRKKVLKGLEQCSSEGCTVGCTYFRVSHCLATLEKDALELLKEQKKTIASLQGTICKLNAALAEQPERKVFVHSDGTIEPLQKHGHWIADIYDFYPPVIICSVCGCEFDANVTKHKYCPECGAVMDEDVKKNGDTL